MCALVTGDQTCALPILLHGSDRDRVVAEHAGHLSQHTRAVAHLDVEVEGRLELVDRTDARCCQLADRRVRALVAVDGRIAPAAEDRARTAGAARAPAVDAQVADCRPPFGSAQRRGRACPAMEYCGVSASLK